jgi:hypothetical protein
MSSLIPEATRAPLVENTLSHLSQINTVPALLTAVGEETCNRWVAIGQTDSKVHWAYGREVDALVSEGAQVGIVCKAIAVKAGKDSQTIRKSWYTWKAFTDDERTKYDLAPFSVFQQARTQENKIEVLEHYINNRASVDEVMVLYPEIEHKDFDVYFKSTKYPRWCYGIERELWGIDPIWKQEADGHIKALVEIAERFNK